MAKLGLILTTDYEIFGNGTGCVEKCMLEPTERMAGILEKYKVPLTVFLDVCEYWAFDAEFKKGNLKEDWAGKIRTQLKQLISRGHDVQLHFHPQWLNYKYENEKWILNFEYWRTGLLPYESTKGIGLKELFKRGKDTLEEIGQQVNSKYECNIFRAGAWSIQPEAYVLKAMKGNGFLLDSSVATGLRYKDSYTYYDFVKAPDLPMWRINDMVNENTPKGDIKEIPIFTAPVSLYKKLNFLRLRKSKGLAIKPTGCEGSALAIAGKGKLEKVFSLLKNSRSMFNFSDAVSSEEMIYFAQHALERYKHSEKLTPIVAISHPKTFANEKELEKFLDWASERKEIEFVKYQAFLND